MSTPTVSMMFDPNEQQVKDAITQEGEGVISDDWKNSAWEAINDWIGGSVRSSPFSYKGQYKVQLALHVVWQWDNGTLKVSVFRG